MSGRFVYFYIHFLLIGKATATKLRYSWLCWWGFHIFYVDVLERLQLSRVVSALYKSTTQILLCVHCPNELHITEKARSRKVKAAPDLRSFLLWENRLKKKSKFSYILHQPFPSHLSSACPFLKSSALTHSGIDQPWATGKPPTLSLSPIPLQNPTF